MRIGSLFSGIGGFELGLERAGVGHTVWQVEKDPFCRAVLARHWPEAERHEDVCTVGVATLAPVDVICGGFPCQDISYAGKGAGLAGDRSGLWYEFARIIREMGPRYVVVENVRALLTRGIDAVLGTLASLGYDAEWCCVRASDVGARHRRERVFVIGYMADAGRLDRERLRDADVMGGAPGPSAGLKDQRQRNGDPACGGGAALAHGHGHGRESERSGRLPDRDEACRHDADGCGERDVGHACCERRHQGCADAWQSGAGRPVSGRADNVGHAVRPRREGADRGGTDLTPQVTTGAGPSGSARPSVAQPRVGRATHGISARLDVAGPGLPQHAWEAPRVVAQAPHRSKRLRALGNAVVPQVAEVVGRRLMEMGQ